MSTVSISAATQKTSLALPILVGGGVAGLLDMTSAYITFGRYMPIGIAGGIVGAAGRHVSVGQYILGLTIHYFIAFSAAAVYCLASKKLKFLRRPFHCLRPVLRDRGVPCDATGCAAAQRLPRYGSVPIPRPGSRPARTHVSHRPADFHQPANAV